MQFSLAYPMIVNCLTKALQYCFIEIIACNNLNRHLVAKAFDKSGQRSYKNHLMHGGV